jgi:hypothetical protein
VFQTSINSVRQKVQAIVKQACAKAGIEVELKTVQASVFFSSDLTNPDTYGKFFADVEMFLNNRVGTDPDRFMQQWVSWEICQKANGWQLQNKCRWSSADYDKLFRASEVELDPVRRAALFVQMNDMACNAGFVVPVALRAQVTALGKSISAPLTGWDLDMSGASTTGSARNRRTGEWERFILRRLALALPSLLGISVVLFTVLALAPGDPFAELATNPTCRPRCACTCARSLGLDDPVALRYLHWLVAMLRGDWGFSFISRVDVDHADLAARAGHPRPDRLVAAAGAGHRDSGGHAVGDEAVFVVRPASPARSRWRASRCRPSSPASC